MGLGLPYTEGLTLSLSHHGETLRIFKLTCKTEDTTTFLLYFAWASLRGPTTQTMGEPN